MDYKPEYSFSRAAKEIRAMGFRVSRNEDGEIRVGWKGNESAAYYTDCPDDAVATARHMATEIAPNSDSEGKALDAGIDCGETGSDWEPTAKNRFYAQHVETGEFAFGDTLENAISALKRDMKQR